VLGRECKVTYKRVCVCIRYIWTPYIRAVSIDILQKQDGKTSSENMLLRRGLLWTRLRISGFRKTWRIFFFSAGKELLVTEKRVPSVGLVLSLYAIGQSKEVKSNANMSRGHSRASRCTPNLSFLITSVTDDRKMVPNIPSCHYMLLM